MIKLAIDEKVLNSTLEKHLVGVRAHFERFEFLGLSGSCWNLVDNWMRTNLKLSFDEVLRASHEELMLIVEKNAKLTNTPNYILDIKNSYKQFATTRGGFGGKDKEEKWNAFSLVSNLELSVCPYCNRNYITSLTKRKKRTCQLDHFFSKDKYPFLALSFFNLIPSCGPCNHIKSTHKVDISPYQVSPMDHLVTFRYKGNFLKFDSVEVDIQNESEFDLNMSVLGIKELYETHKDYIYEILIKKETYPLTFIEEIYLNHTELYKNKEEVLSFIFSNYLSVDKYQNRPLSKLTSDILKQLKMI